MDFDDRVEQLLFAQADKRNSFDWSREDVIPVISALLDERDALEKRAELAETSLEDVEDRHTETWKKYYQTYMKLLVIQRDFTEIREQLLSENKS